VNRYEKHSPNTKKEQVFVAIADIAMTRKNSKDAICRLCRYIFYQHVTSHTKNRYMIRMESFTRFYTNHRDKLFRYLLQKCGNIAQANDLMQESFTRYLERYGTVKEELPLLFTIGRNLFYDQLRRPQERPLPAEIADSSSTDLESSYLVDEQTRRVQNALLRLADEERDILSLAVNSNLGYREIARIHRCSVTNVKIKVHRARLKLKKMLEEQNNG